MGCYRRGGCKRAAQQPDCGVVRIPPKPFDILPSGLIPPPSPKGPLGVPLGRLPLKKPQEW